jgi:hypothetical protein
MKRISFVLFISILFAALSGCGSHITKGEFLNKALENEITSFETNAMIEGEVTANGQSMTQSMKMDMKYVTKPVLAHVNISTVDQKIEMYLDDENVYLNQTGIEGWMKGSIEKIPSFAELADGNAISDEIVRLKGFEELFTFEEKDSEFILNVTLTEETNEKGLELLKELLMDEMQTELELEDFDVKINEFDYTLKFDKEILLNSTTVNLDLEVVVDGNLQRIVSSVEATFKNVNKVGPFDIPEEAVNNAMEF